MALTKKPGTQKNSIRPKKRKRTIKLSKPSMGKVLKKLSESEKIKTALSSNDLTAFRDIISTDPTIIGSTVLEESLFTVFDILSTSPEVQKLIQLGNGLRIPVLQELVEIFEIELSEEFYDIRDGATDGLPYPIVWYRFSSSCVSEDGSRKVILRRPKEKEWRSDKKTIAAKTYNAFINKMIQEGYAGNKDRSALIAEKRITILISKLEALLSQLSKAWETFDISIDGAKEMSSRLDALTQSLGIENKPQLIATLVDWRVTLDEPFWRKDLTPYQLKKVKYISKHIRDRIFINKIK